MYCENTSIILFSNYELNFWKIFILNIYVEGTIFGDIKRVKICIMISSNRIIFLKIIILLVFNLID
jgi:hypothetical protein